MNATATTQYPWRNGKIFDETTVRNLIKAKISTLYTDMHKNRVEAITTILTLREKHLMNGGGKHNDTDLAIMIARDTGSSWEYVAIAIRNDGVWGKIIPENQNGSIMTVSWGC